VFVQQKFVWVLRQDSVDYKYLKKPIRRSKR